MRQAILFVIFAIFAGTAWGEEKLVVHEWGTFTSLQDEEGKAIGGINTDDEPVPQFVHRLSGLFLLPPGRSASVPAAMSKGITPRCHPDVTMRLETPVIYFHPSPLWKPQPVDVRVTFPGGWLTEFYPDAGAHAPGFDRDNPGRFFSETASGSQERVVKFGHLSEKATGDLAWRKLIVGAEGTGPETDEKVWLAPRDVKAATVKTSEGEAEKFLFYRGVGNVDAPLRIVRNTGNNTLEAHDASRLLAMLNPEENLRIHAAWLVDVRADGMCAFKSLGKLEFGKEIRAAMPAEFDQHAYSTDNMKALQGEMRAGLIAEGLFPDEADALLKTWQVSYFMNPGMRFFYLCPRVDIDHALPLEISVPADVTRVMVGRIEIVTPGQRALLGRIAGGREERDAQYGEYKNLGRFRNALILDEQKRHPSPVLRSFIQENSLDEYKVE